MRQHDPFSLDPGQLDERDEPREQVLRIADITPFPRETAAASLGEAGSEERAVGRVGSEPAVDDVVLDCVVIRDSLTPISLSRTGPDESRPSGSGKTSSLDLSDISAPRGLETTDPSIRPPI